METECFHDYIMPHWKCKPPPWGVHWKFPVWWRYTHSPCLHWFRLGPEIGALFLWWWILLQESALMELSLSCDRSYQRELWTLEDGEFLWAGHEDFEAGKASRVLNVLLIKDTGLGPWAAMSPEHPRQLTCRFVNVTWGRCRLRQAQFEGVTPFNE